MLYAVHTFELYGFGRPPVEPATLYGLDPHMGCDLAVFCRNPLHPGPCKGWKHTLKAVAPGLHDEVEKTRLDRVHARREEKRQAALDAGLKEPKFRKLKHEREGTGPVDRKGQGEGRDGDGDGLKGEGEYKKRGRRKAAPKEEPAPQEKRLVTLSPETRKAVADAIKVLPKDDEGWRAIARKKVVHDDFADLVAENQRQLHERIDTEVGGRGNWVDVVNIGRKRRGEAPFKTWEDLRKGDPEMASEYMDIEGKRRLTALDEARQRYDVTSQALKDANEQIARLGGRGPDGSLPDGFVPPANFRARNFEGRVEYAAPDYQKDRAGRELPAPELVAMQESVSRAGAAINADIQKALAVGAPEREQARHRARLLSNNSYSVSGDERARMRAESKQIYADTMREERAVVLDALAQLRPMGGQKFGNMRAMASPAEINSNIVGNTSNYLPAPPNWREQMDEAAAHFPDDWVRRADRQELMLVSTDRAHMSSRGGDWLKPADPGRYGVMAMDAGNAGSTGGTSFKTYGAEVTYHETGHWMETNIPGLKALEFAYVRSRTTHNGQVEPLVKLEDVVGGGYEPGEVAFKDKFEHAYTGKSYESHSRDPASSPWEAFQVGLQQVFGRGPGASYGGESLDHFVLGVMATLGRS